MIMNEKKIWQKLDSMYEDKKSQKFIDHLIKSYIPKSKIEKVIDTPKGRFRCALTNMNLVAISDVYNEIGDHTDKRNKFADFINTMFDEEVVSPPNLNIFKRKSIGLTGKDTDTFLRYETYIAFFNWIKKKLIEDDKHINWLIKQMQIDSDGEFRIQRVKEEGSEKETVKFVKSKDKKATFADLDILHEIKVKLSEQERK